MSCMVWYLVGVLSAVAVLSSCITPQKNKVSDGLIAGEISSVVMKNFNQIQHCYEQFLQRMPGISNKIMCRFTITAEGRVASLTLKESGLVNSDFIACLTKVIKAWQFPPPRGNKRVEVTYPFIFSPCPEVVPPSAKHQCAQG